MFQQGFRLPFDNCRNGHLIELAPALFVFDMFEHVNALWGDLEAGASDAV